MLRTRNIVFIQRRWKGGKQRWSVVQKKKAVTDRVLENFDDFYGTVFGVRWNNMRAALLSEQKYVAMVNNFGDIEKTCNLFEGMGAINIRSLFSLAKERSVIENSSSMPNQTVYKLDDRLGGIIKNQEDREKQSIYPENSEKEENVNHNNPFQSENKEETENETTSNKSLEGAIEKTTELDTRRIIDTESGSSGLYDYIPATNLKGMEDWIPESNYYKYYQTTTDFPLQIELETELAFPDNLCLYTYEMGNCTKFKSPFKCLTGVLSHYLMDGSSILPPLFLDVQPGEKVLDACAAPGGKSLLMLETLHPEILVCNDVQESRVNRIRKSMTEYLIDFSDRWEGKRCLLTQRDARGIDEFEMYDKILVDVPCTTDRHSLNEIDNNIFRSSRLKERLRIPELQANILTNCIRLLKPGGSLVYSTCSLSPIQNDGVVHMAMHEAFNEHGITVKVKDLSFLIQLFSDIFKFENPKGLKYGQMVVPFLPANFGPAYFCKITRK
ncbi:5-methylcytosine rRNA methyltransferase NSUN4 [Episyrphus balteatus]|uniref:5-methylcytosine rRNA methyltransferase NSUN4 n=1 Tax=Episyrphus balteatus TaxID=286459 RepID=UPI0024859E47|nr:5-methylcytosine rRNA methyltransferase NSUN4 [Episyrphus balteatus]